jgi:hypothetical protein
MSSMNNIQKIAHDEGFTLVAAAFNKGEQFNVGTAVSWVNLCLAKDTLTEELSLIDRDGNGEMVQVRKFTASRSEMCGYRLAGVFAGLESVRFELARHGVSLKFKTP